MHIPQKEGSAKIGSIWEEVRESGNEMYLCVVSSKENDGTKLKSPLVYYYYSLFCEKLYFHMSFFLKKNFYGAALYQYASLSYHSYNEVFHKDISLGGFCPHTHGNSTGIVA